MPAWLLAALGLLGAAGVVDPGGGVPFLPATVDPFERGGLQLPGFFGRRDDDKRRRRRRRALTQSDRNDIAFIAATIGKTAAGSFAVQLATRSR